MTEARIADTKPMVLKLEAGKSYWFCRCGHSSNQPFCDGSHKGTGLEPLEFSAGEDSKAALCMCKHSARLPFCDGTHSKLDIPGTSTD